MRNHLKARITDLYNGDDPGALADALDAVLDLCEEYETFAASMGNPYPHWVTHVYRVIDREL